MLPTKSASPVQFGMALGLEDKAAEIIADLTSAWPS
jgi:hypothetical protein